MSLLTHFLPSWLQYLLGFVSVTGLILIVAVVWFGGGKVVMDFLDPIAKWFGDALVTFLGWLFDAVGIAYRNPEIFSLLAVVVLVLGCRYYVPLRWELATAQTQLAQCKAPKVSKKPGKSSDLSVAYIEQQASELIAQARGIFGSKSDAGGPLSAPSQRGWSLN